MKKFIGTYAVIAAISMLAATIVGAESDSSRINRGRKAIGRELIEMQSDN